MRRILWVLGAVAVGVCLVQVRSRVTAAGLPFALPPARPAPLPAVVPALPACNLRLPSLVPHQDRITALLGEMRGVDVSTLKPLSIPRYVVPKASVDVMRVRLEETYDVAGVGSDTVELHGWIAVAHADPRPAHGETEVRWGTTVSDTEFVGLELNGESKLFGPVEVRLDTSRPSVGQVGKLDIPFPVHLAFNLAYARHALAGRPAPAGLRAAAGTAPTLQARPAPLTLLQRPAGADAQAAPAGDTAQSDVMAAMTGLWNAIGAKNPSAMLSYYAPTGQFFNTMYPAQSATSSAQYISTLAKVFDTIDTIQVIPSLPAQVDVSGPRAFVRVSGVNQVVDLENHYYQGHWRESAELQLGSSGWRITSDHLSFHNDFGVITPSACNCVANASVTIDMPRLDLHMATAGPAQWYSEVDTIPPVGQTASISLVPTPLVSGGRQVAMLTSGAVKFREVVRRVWLDGPGTTRRGL